MRNVLDLRIAGLGIILYSPFAVTHIREGQDYLAELSLSKISSAGMRSLAIQPIVELETLHRRSELESEGRTSCIANAS